jgi:hypothetical protein
MIMTRAINTVIMVLVLTLLKLNPPPDVVVVGLLMSIAHFDDNTVDLREEL